MAERVISKKEFAARKGISPPTLDRQETAARDKAHPEHETFPRRRRIGGGRVGFLESEVDAYLLSLPVGPLTERTAAARATPRRKSAKAVRAERSGGEAA